MLEEQALKLGGDDIYRIFIKEYTEKQWGCPATELPAFIIRRLPFRFVYDNNYFNDPYQGIPSILNSGTNLILLLRGNIHRHMRLGGNLTIQSIMKRIWSE